MNRERAFKILESINGVRRPWEVEGGVAAWVQHGKAFRPQWVQQRLSSEDLDLVRGWQAAGVSTVDCAARMGVSAAALYARTRRERARLSDEIPREDLKTLGRDEAFALIESFAAGRRPWQVPKGRLALRQWLREYEDEHGGYFAPELDDAERTAIIRWRYKIGYSTRLIAECYGFTRTRMYKYTNRRALNERSFAITDAQ